MANTKVQGTVKSVNDKGFKLEGSENWINFSKYGDRPPNPSKGDRVEVEVDDKGYVHAIKTLEAAAENAGGGNGGGPRSNSNWSPEAEARVTRLASLKAAVDFYQGRQDIKAADVLIVAHAWSEWGMTGKLPEGLKPSQAAADHQPQSKQTESKPAADQKAETPATGSEPKEKKAAAADAPAKLDDLERYRKALARAATYGITAEEYRLSAQPTRAELVEKAPKLGVALAAFEIQVADDPLAVEYEKLRQLAGSKDTDYPELQLPANRQSTERMMGIMRRELDEQAKVNADAAEQLSAL